MRLCAHAPRLPRDAGAQHAQMRARRAPGLRVRAGGGSLDAVPPSLSLLNERWMHAVLRSEMQAEVLRASDVVDIVWTATEAAGSTDKPVPPPEPPGFMGAVFSGLRGAATAAFDTLTKDLSQRNIALFSRFSASQDAFPSEDVDAAQATSTLHALLCVLDRPGPSFDIPLAVGCAVLQYRLSDDSKLPEMRWSDSFLLSAMEPATFGDALYPAWQRAERRAGALLASICREEVPAELRQSGDPPVDVDFKKRRVGLLGCQRLMLDVAMKYQPQTGGLDGKPWAQAVGLVTQSLRLVGRALWWQYCPQCQFTNYEMAPQLVAPPEAAPPKLWVLVPPALADDIPLIEAHVRSFLHPHQLGHACLPSLMADMEVLDDSLRLSAELGAAGALDWKEVANTLVLRSIRHTLMRLIQSGRREAARLLAWHCMRTDTGVDERSKVYAESYSTFGHLNSDVMSFAVPTTDAGMVFNRDLGPSGSHLTLALVLLDESDDAVRRALDHAMCAANVQTGSRLFVIGCGGSANHEASTARLVRLVGEVSAYFSPLVRDTNLFLSQALVTPGIVGLDAVTAEGREALAELMELLVRRLPDVPEDSKVLPMIFDFNFRLAKVRLQAFQQAAGVERDAVANFARRAIFSLVLDRAFHDAFEAGAALLDVGTWNFDDEKCSFENSRFPGLGASASLNERFYDYAISRFERESMLSQSVQSATSRSMGRDQSGAKQKKRDAVALAAKEKKAREKADLERKQAAERERQAKLKAAAQAERERAVVEAARKLQQEREAAERVQAAARACADEAAEAAAAGWPLPRWLEAEPRWRAALAAASETDSPAVEALRAAVAPLSDASALASRLRTAAAASAQADASSREGALAQLQAVIAEAMASPSAVQRMIDGELAQAASEAQKLEAAAALMAAVQSRDPQRIRAAEEAAQAAGVSVVQVMMEAMNQQAVALQQPESPPLSTRPKRKGNWLPAGPKMWFDNTRETALGFGSGTVVFRGAFVTERGKLEEAAVKRMVRDLTPGRGDKQLQLVRREFDITRELTMKSTHVVSPLDFWEGRDFIYIGFAQCKESLRQLLEKCKDRKSPLPTATALAHLRELATAVEELHRCDYAHNDLHAGNVLFTAEGELKVADLQLSMRTNSDAENTQLSMSGSTLNLKNRAPEVVRNAQLPGPLQKPLTPAVDVYSFGVLMLQLLMCDASLEVQLRPPAREVASAPATRGGRRQLKVVPKEGLPVADPSSVDKLRLPAHVRAEAAALLRACLAESPAARPSAAAVRAHPLFWDDTEAAAAMRRLYELEQMRPNAGPRDKEAMLQHWLEQGGLGDAHAELAAWQSAVHRPLLRWLTQPRGAFKGADYGAGLEQLLRFVRNAAEHPPDPDALPAAFTPAEPTKEASRAAVQSYVRATWPRLALAVHACLRVVDGN